MIFCSIYPVLRARVTQTLVAGLLVLSVLAAPVHANVESVSIGLAPGSPTNLIDGGVNTGTFIVSVTVADIPATNPDWVVVRFLGIENSNITLNFGSGFLDVRRSTRFEITAPVGTRFGNAIIELSPISPLLITSTAFTPDDKTATVTMSITALDVDPSNYSTITFTPIDARYYERLFAGIPVSPVGTTSTSATGSAEFTIVNGIVSLQADPSSITEDAAGDNSTVVTLELASTAGSSISIPYSIDDSGGDIMTGSTGDL